MVSVQISIDSDTSDASQLRSSVCDLCVAVLISLGEPGAFLIARDHLVAREVSRNSYNLGRDWKVAANVGSLGA